MSISLAEGDIECKDVIKTGLWFHFNYNIHKMCVLWQALEMSALRFFYS